jgi:hypothetical protein
MGVTYQFGDERFPAPSRGWSSLSAGTNQTLVSSCKWQFGAESWGLLLAVKPLKLRKAILEKGTKLNYKTG